MSGNVRKQIREQVALQVDKVFTIGKTYSTRIVDARDGQPYCNVFFADGSAEYEGLQLICESELVIGVHLPWSANTDDNLDDIADAIVSLFQADPNITLDNVAAGFIYSGFEYGEEDESPYTRIYIKFTVQY